MKATPRALWIAAMSCGAVAMMLPFWVMLSTALMRPEQVYAYPPAFWPSPPTFDNFTHLFQAIPLGRYFLNSLLVASTTTVGHVLLSAMAAYGFSRFRFAGRNAWFFVFLATMMIPPQVNTVPLFFEMKLLHWVDTYWGLIVPGLFGAFGVFLMRQWFNGLPMEIEEAAAIDGANPWQTFWQVAFPLARPAWVALGILVFIGSWNSLLWPLVLVQSEPMQTLPVAIATLKSSFRDVTDWGLLMAASFLSVVPTVVLFLIGQKQFVQGLTQGGVKE